MNTASLERMTDEQLLGELNAAAGKERGATAHLVALLAEMDSRTLYLEQGYSSMFVYCTRCLKLSEHAAYGRIASLTNIHGRNVPAAVKRAVWARDGGQCAFVGTEGRCTERGFLEFHHVILFAEGGTTTVENLQLRCRAHNAYEAKTHFDPFLLRERWMMNSVRTEFAIGADIAPSPA